MVARLLARLRRPAPPIDQTGPATAYPHHAGAYGTTTGRPDWNGPTYILMTSPLMTLGQRYRAGVRP